MFRNRKNSQRPNDELLAAFKQNYPGVTQNASAAETAAQKADLDSLDTAATGAGPAPDSGLHQPSSSEHHAHDLTTAGDTTPSRFAMDQWRLTPSLFDPHAFQMGQVGASQMNYYTPTPGGPNSIYHNQTAGDLHTPGLAFQLGTPLSMPLPETTLHAGSAFDQSFNPQMFGQHGFDANQLFGSQHLSEDQHNPPSQQQQQLVPPSMLIHKDSGIGGSDNSPIPGMAGSEDLQGQARQDDYDQKHGVWMENPLLEQFRYQTALNAPTAMIRTQDEVPVTYLNKGQAYTLSILDSLPISPPSRPVRYRTTVRISFEDEEQRARPGQCWQLWKEGRGLAESHQRGGKLQAVEYVDPHPGAADDDPRKPRIRVEKESFDGFSVSWSPATLATSPNAECAIAVRFNFLSTDFSHSKGVKGIPVRLCTKTHMLIDEETDGEGFGTALDADESTQTEVKHPADAEVVYCKVKLFRDHGAERKLTNDVAHVKKSIDKLKAQIQQLESGIKEPGRRKRTSMSLGKMDSERPAKIPKHKRTWSVSSTGSGGLASGNPGGKPSAEEDLNDKLSTLQEMFTSTRPVSVLFLRGEEGDDMDSFPVSLGGDMEPHRQQNVHTNSWDRPASDRSESGSTMPSPIATTKRIPGAPFEPNLATTSQNLRKIRRGSITFEAVDVHPSYVAPMAPVDKAVACVYVRAKDENAYYKAVYLWSRTKRELLARICQKFGLSSENVEAMIRVTAGGLEVEMDDETVQQMNEGEDIIVQTDAMGGCVKSESSAPSDRPPDGLNSMILRLFY